MFWYLALPMISAAGLVLAAVIAFILRRWGSSVYPYLEYIFKMLILVSIIGFAFLPLTFEEKLLLRDQPGVMLNPKIYIVFGVQLFLYLAALFGFRRPFAPANRAIYYRTVLYPFILFVLLFSMIFTTLKRDGERYERIYHEMGGTRHG